MSEQDEYTPSVKQVRDTYASIYAYTTDRAAAFDRMIERVRREAAAEQREKDAQIVEHDYLWDVWPYNNMDERRSAWYAYGRRDAAAAIREQGNE